MLNMGMCDYNCRKAVFLDRDGTINVEKGYVHRIEDWEWIDGAIEAIREINAMGFLAIVVSNQAGVARGYYQVEDVVKLHRWVDDQLKSVGAWIDGWYFCPHHPYFGTTHACACRKPKPGLLLEAKRVHGIDLEKSFLVGDKMSDIRAGQAAMVSSLLVRTGHGRVAEMENEINLRYFDDVFSAINYIQHGFLS